MAPPPITSATARIAPPPLTSVRRFVEKMRLNEVRNDPSAQISGRLHPSATGSLYQLQLGGCLERARSVLEGSITAGGDGRLARSIDWLTAGTEQTPGPEVIKNFTVLGSVLSGLDYQLESKPGDPVLLELRQKIEQAVLGLGKAMSACRYPPIGSYDSSDARATKKLVVEYGKCSEAVSDCMKALGLASQIEATAQAVVAPMMLEAIAIRQPEMLAKAKAGELGPDRLMNLLEPNRVQSTNNKIAVALAGDNFRSYWDAVKTLMKLPEYVETPDPGKAGPSGNAGGNNGPTIPQNLLDHSRNNGGAPIAYANNTVELGDAVQKICDAQRSSAQDLPALVDAVAGHLMAFLNRGVELGKQSADISGQLNYIRNQGEDLQEQVDALRGDNSRLGMQLDELREILSVEVQQHDEDAVSPGNGVVTAPINLLRADEVSMAEVGHETVGELGANQSRAQSAGALGNVADVGYPLPRATVVEARVGEFVALIHQNPSAGDDTSRRERLESEPMRVDVKALAKEFESDESLEVVLPSFFRQTSVNARNQSSNSSSMDASRVRGVPPVDVRGDWNAVFSDYVEVLNSEGAGREVVTKLEPGKVGEGLTVVRELKSPVPQVRTVSVKDFTAFVTERSADSVNEAPLRRVSQATSGISMGAGQLPPVSVLGELKRIMTRHEAEHPDGNTSLALDLVKEVVKDYREEIRGQSHAGEQQSDLVIRVAEGDDAQSVSSSEAPDWADDAEMQNILAMSQPPPRPSFLNHSLGGDATPRSSRLNFPRPTFYAWVNQQGDLASKRLGTTEEKDITVNGRESMPVFHSQHHLDSMRNARSISNKVSSVYGSSTEISDDFDSDDEGSDSVVRGASVGMLASEGGAGSEAMTQWNLMLNRNAVRARQ